MKSFSIIQDRLQQKIKLLQSLRTIRPPHPMQKRDPVAGSVYFSKLAVTLTEVEGSQSCLFNSPMSCGEAVRMN